VRNGGSKRLISGLLVIAASARAVEPPPPPPDEGRAAPSAQVPIAALPSGSDQRTWTLRVHLFTKDDRVELRRLTDDALICKAPCGAVVQFHEQDAFAFRGEGLLPSAPFQFRPRDGDVTLRVDPGSAAPRYLGAGLLAVGGTAALISLLAVPLVGNTVFCDGDPSCIAQHNDDRQTALTVGLVALGAAVLGGVLLALTHPTTYSADE
jgi:hypothetical protein